MNTTTDKLSFDPYEIVRVRRVYGDGEERFEFSARMADGTRIPESHGVRHIVSQAEAAFSILDAIRKPRDVLQKSTETAA